MSAAAAFLGAGTAAADPVDDVANALTAQLPNSSADIGGLQDLLPNIPGLGSLLRPNGAPGTTRCTSVIQIGDSTSVGVDDASRVPAATDTLSAQYKRVGATTVDLDADGGRSIVEKLNGKPNADDAVAAHLARGERGCWVIAMGVNDAANIAVGSSVDADARIDRIMSQLQGQPVLWPTVTTANPGNPAYNAAAMNSFNNALRRASVRYANLAVYDWAAVAQPSMFVDGIHYTAAGSAERNRRFADALATAFPPGTGATPTLKWVAG
ncbi:SGNH/GDSL hydrolase family protein [Gordonia oryzae]|uniref:SGNH/GDSL hydrolase family protein n=1 Tax=Gordonia oryzae TaxID=2487349 RepID=UPI00269E0412